MTDAAIPFDDQADAGILAHVPSILRQRYRWILIPTVIGLVGGTAAAFLLPRLYESSATVLVESQQVSDALVGNNTNTNQMVEERLARVRQQILSRENLVELIKANNLYPGEQGSTPLSTLVEKMREATSIRPDNADFRRNSESLISFKVSFEYPDRNGAQIVAQEYVERLVQLDSKERGDAAQTTATFLREQASQLSGQIKAIESKVAEIKAKYGTVLAGGAGVIIPPSSGGYDSQIAMLQRENSQLMQSLRSSGTDANRDPVVMAAETRLAQLRSTYSDSHPDVKAAEQQLAEARSLAQRTAAENPSIAMTRQTIAANNAMIASLNAARAGDMSRAQEIINKSSEQPLINEQINQLNSRAEELRARYQSVAANLMTAEANVRLADEQKGERLTIIDAPVTPDRPSTPNRPLLIGGGTAAGLGLGLLLVVLLEMLLRPVRGIDSVRSILGRPPLGVIPTLHGDDEKPKRFQRWFRRRQPAAA